MYFIILGVFMLVGMVVSARLKSKFNQYGRMANSTGMNGAEVAQAMLQHYGIHDVRITQGQGMLTDHYNPQEKTIALSPEVYQGRSISAAAVAAHECGHAVQHSEKYTMLEFRSKMVPVVMFSSRMQQFLFMGVLFGMGAGMSGGLMMGVMVATFGITALFSLVTLPVEFDASNRALAWLDNSGVTRGTEYEGAKDALWWAAMTYVVQALSALTMFLYFLLNFMNRD